MIVDTKANELHLKLVYYGPGLAGKTTNLRYVHERTNPVARTKMVSLTTETARTLYFSFLPQTLKPIDGKRVRFFLHTVPGPVFYDTSRRFVLKDVDGIVFVADAQSERSEANLESFENLESNLEAHGLRLTDVPIVIQYNKCDLPNRMSLPSLQTLLNPHRLLEFETVARTGAGVFDTLQTAAKKMLQRILRPSGSPYRDRG